MLSCPSIAKSVPLRTFVPLPLSGTLALSFVVLRVVASAVKSIGVQSYAVDATPEVPVTLPFPLV